jgi:hypothetical protein
VVLGTASKQNTAENSYSQEINLVIERPIINFAQFANLIANTMLAGSPYISSVRHFFLFESNFLQNK